MKGILEFDLDDFDDKNKFELAGKVLDYQMFVWDYGQEVLRKYYKYGLPDEYKNNADALLEHLRDEFYRLKEERGLQDPL